MLHSRQMLRQFCTRIVLVGVAYLLVIPKPFAFAGHLNEQAVAYRAQGYEAQQRGDNATALSLYQKAAALDPTYATPQNDLGVLLEEQGRLDEAERAYREALKIDPKYLEAHSNLAMLYERKGDQEKAIYHWLKRYQLGDPYDPWTARAEERLMALGMLKRYPGMKGQFYTRKRLVSETFKDHAKSLAEFHATTKEYGDWP